MRARRTFVCDCRNLAYWVKRFGWHCMCGNPRQNGVEKKSPKKGPLVR